MAIEIFTQPYEILFRFTDGVVSGCHYKTIEIVRDDQRVYSSTEGNALPVALGGVEVEQVIGTINSGLTIRIAELEQQLATAQAAIEAAIQAENDAAHHQEPMLDMPDGPVQLPA